MALFKPAQGRLERFALAMTRDADSARDVVAETVMVAWERFDTLRSPDAFLSFLFTIATRVHRAAERKRGPVTSDISAETIENILDPGTPPDVAADIAAVYHALHDLPERQREALVMFEILGFTMKEIRDVQGGTLTAVKVRVHRGRKRLAELLGVDDTAEESFRAERTSASPSRIEDKALFSIGTEL